MKHHENCNTNDTNIEGIKKPCNCGASPSPPCSAVSIPLAEYEALKKDRARLDYLERAHTALNTQFGTNYGWELIINHNVVRFMSAHCYPRDGFDGIDLHDSVGGKGKKDTCRQAIDLSMQGVQTTP